MKKRLACVLFLSVFASYAYGQLNVWRWQNPVPVGNYLRAVQMLSSSTVYACGDNATFMRSVDGGNTWDIHSSLLKLTTNFYTISFLNAQYGFCAGDSGKVLRTTDGGTNWSLTSPNVKTKINGILALDENIVVCVTHQGTIFRSVDKGDTWVQIGLEGVPELLSIRMTSPTLSTIVGVNGTFIRSTDKWASAETLPVKVSGKQIANNFFCCNFADNNNGTIIGENGIILRTTDGGGNWVFQGLPDSLQVTATLNVIAGSDPNILAIVGEHAALLYTVDGGTTWHNSSPLGTLDAIKGLSFSDKLTATAVGRNGLVIHTSDGGATWAFQPHIPYTQILHSIAFPRGDTSLGIAVGNNGTIMRTPDGGKNWSVIESGVDAMLNGVAFADKQNVFAVGEYGTIIKSTNAGMSWVRQTSPTSQILNSISFATPSAGIIVGDGATILTTASGGVSWTNRWTDPPTTDYFTGVSYPDSVHAFLCGRASIYKTIDGGVNWFLAPGGAYSRGTAISFADSLHGGFCNSDKYAIGYTRSTNDGGVTFDSVYPDPAGRSILGICYSDRQHATVVGAFGNIYHSINNGADWITQPSNTLNTLNAVAFGTVSAGTAVGIRGNIMRITSDDKLAVPVTGAVAPDQPVIESVYPNPLSAQTTIRCILPQSGFTSLDAYSIDGKHVANIRSGYLSGGQHEFNWSAGNVAEGTYIIELVLSDKLRTVTQVVIRK